MGAGKRRERIAFEKRAVAADDGYGNTFGGWEEQFVRWASMTPMRRGEAVIASRLSGVQPYILNILADSQSREIATDWRARNVNTDTVYNIRTVEPSASRAEIDLLVEQGVADG